MAERRSEAVGLGQPNPAARTLYESMGFRTTGERQPWGEAGERVEERLRIRAG